MQKSGKIFLITSKRNESAIDKLVLDKANLTKETDSEINGNIKYDKEVYF